MNDKIVNYVKSHDIINRVFNMLEFYELINDSFIKNSIGKRLVSDIEFVELLASFFYRKTKDKKNSVDLQINLVNLINDLDYLKQYLDA